MACGKKNRLTRLNADSEKSLDVCQKNRDTPMYHLIVRPSNIHFSSSMLFAGYK